MHADAVDSSADSLIYTVRQLSAGRRKPQPARGACPPAWPPGRPAPGIIEVNQVRRNLQRTQTSQVDDAPTVTGHLTPSPLPETDVKYTHVGCEVRRMLCRR